MFGNELFNSQGKFFNYTSLDFSDSEERVLHSDLAHILFGMGIVGTIIFILYHIFILKYFNSIKDKRFEINNSRALQAVFYGIFVCLIINIFEDGILGFPNRVYPFLYIGCILGLISYNKKQLADINKTFHYTNR
jgi:O-antigen ligase